MDDLFPGGPSKELLFKAAELGLISKPSIEYRAEPSGRGSGLAVVVVDQWGREHVYVTTNALAIAEHILSTIAARSGPCKT